VGGVAFERDNVNVPLWEHYAASMVLCYQCRRWPAGTPLGSRTRSPSSWPGTRYRSRLSASAAAISSRSWPSASAQPGSTRRKRQRGPTRMTDSPARAPARVPAPCPATTSTSPCAHGTATTCPAQASCAAYYGPPRSGKASAWALATAGRRPLTTSTRMGSPASTMSLRALCSRTQCQKSRSPRYRSLRYQGPGEQGAGAQDSGSGLPGARLAAPAGGT
jgi:hypothetical protein